MSVRQGREFLMIPGPTTVPDEVLAAMHRPAIEIYGGRMLEITMSVLADLQRVFRTAGETYVYPANGHGAWEAAIANTLSRGDKVLVLESGRFAVGWGEMGSIMGVEVERLPCDWRCAVDPAQVEERLKRDTAGEIKAILVVQVDTASGAVNDIPAIRRAIDAAGHGALFMVDTIASLATMPYEMDQWGVDVTVSASQKGLMTPPGLSFIAAGPRALDAHRVAGLRSLYWDWTRRHEPEHYRKYCGTAPVHMMYGLRAALDMIAAEGLEHVIARHRILAGAVQAAVARWCEAGALEFNIPDPAARAPGVTTVLTPAGSDPAALRTYCDNKLGVVLGLGIGELTGKAFRIAHMGHINAPMVFGTLGAVEAGLKATGIPHTPGGVQAAVEHVAKEVPAA